MSYLFDDWFLIMVVLPVCVGLGMFAIEWAINWITNKIAEYQPLPTSEELRRFFNLDHFLNSLD